MSSLAKTITEKIRLTVCAIDADAEVYIYGSRARGEATDESDWDIMVITHKDATPQLKQSIRHALYNIEWDNGCVISSIIHSREEWASPLMRLTPFYQNVTSQAVRI